jgi:hypothetical protein
MAKRIENADEDDLGQGGVELAEQEFEEFLALLAEHGVEPEVIDLIREHGFFCPVHRPGFEAMFRLYDIPADVEFMALCREGRLKAMKEFIALQFSEGTWPDPPS